MSLKQTSGEGFMGRWSRLKRDTAATEAQAAPAAPAMPMPEGDGFLEDKDDATGLRHPPESADQATGLDERRQPASVLPSIESLGKDSDYSAFMKADVDPGLRLSALKKMFTDPHFNQMDGLDIYIDDYTRPDPIPLAMLKGLNQSRMLNLFAEEEPDQNGSSSTTAQSLPAAAQDPAAAEASAEASPEASLEAAAAAERPVESPDTFAPAASASPTPPSIFPASPHLPEPQDDAADSTAAAPVANAESPVSGKPA